MRGGDQVTYSVKVTDSYCRDCGDEEVYMDVKEEPGLYKVGAYCQGCDHDYGVLEYISRDDVDHVDEVWSEAESVVHSYLE